MTTAKREWSSTILVPVFLPAVIVIALMVIGTVSNPELAGEVFADTLAYVTSSFGWFYMLAVALFLIFIVSVAFSSWGSTKLGPDHAEPEYDFKSWFAMLFSAGYGIALLFFGVAEPVLHYASPPAGAPRPLMPPSRRCRSPIPLGLPYLGHLRSGRSVAGLFCLPPRPAAGDALNPLPADW